MGPSFLQLEHTRTTVPGDDFEFVNGGTDRVCRGADREDSSPSHFTVFDGDNLEACKARCRATAGCVGIEHGAPSRCEVWTRRNGISTSASRRGYTCLRYVPFQPVDGGVNRACRGANAQDNSHSHFQVLTDVLFLAVCQARCLTRAGCIGVEFNKQTKRCELWTRPQGVGSSRRLDGFTCMRRTTSQAPAPAPVPATKEGCACLKSWTMSGFANSPCENYCCNPDSDPSGAWCFVKHSTCQGETWGYCANPPPPVPAPTTTTAAPTPVDWLVGLVRAEEWEHFRLVNQLRQTGFTCPRGKRFLPNPIPLKLDCRLYAAARKHSQDMADKSYFSHDTLDGRSFIDRARAEGISANAENIGAACKEPACSFRQFRDSDAHCRNLMNPGLKLFAVGRAYNAGSRYKYYWTELFTAEDSTPNTSCYGAAR